MIIPAYRTITLVEGSQKMTPPLCLPTTATLTISNATDYELLHSDLCRLQNSMGPLSLDHFWITVADAQNTAGNSARAQEAERSSDGPLPPKSRRAAASGGDSNAELAALALQRKAARAFLHAGVGHRAPAAPASAFLRGPHEPFDAIVVISTSYIRIYTVLVIHEY